MEEGLFPVLKDNEDKLRVLESLKQTSENTDGISTKTSSEEKQHTCEICGKRLKTKKNLRTHLKIHSTEKQFHCMHCEKRFHRKRTFETHLRIHTDERPFNCGQCSETFRYQNDLHKHMKKHTGEVSYSCEVCFEAFPDESIFVTHIETHPGSYVCKTCGTTFAKWHYLQFHIKRRHNELYRYPCNHCDKKFQTKLGLQFHIPTHGENKYLCSYCGKRFVHFGSFEYHIKTHTGEKPFICEMCKKSFRSKNNLRAHITVHHTSTEDRKKYACCKCGKKFLNLCTLQDHRCRREFQCENCDLYFKCQENLDTHRLIHTATNSLVQSSEKYQTCESLKKYKCCVIVILDGRFKSDIKKKTKKLKVTKAKPPAVFDKCIKCGVAKRDCRMKKHVCKVSKFKSDIKEAEKSKEKRVKPQMVFVNCTKCGVTKRDCWMRKHVCNFSRYLPYHCVNCGKNFYSKYYKSQHNCTEVLKKKAELREPTILIGEEAAEHTNPVDGSLVRGMADPTEEKEDKTKHGQNIVEIKEEYQENDDKKLSFTFKIDGYGILVQEQKAEVQDSRKP